MGKGRFKTANYTERAMATVTIPSFVYVPKMHRPGQGRVSVKISNVEISQNHARIADADPLGFQIAVMNGQPIPEFFVNEKRELELGYHIPTMDERLEAARWLGTRVTFKTPDSYKKPGGAGQHAQDYDALIARRANGQEEGGEDRGGDSGNNGGGGNSGRD